MSFDPNEPTGTDPSFTDTMPPPPPPPPQAPIEGRLVRDPYSRLGGVASGLSHHYGIDVSVLRIVFVLTTLASGVGLLVYLLAWMIIPRATYWPPAGTARPVRSLSGRDLGLGLALIGLMVAFGFGAGGATGSILIPLVLVGGGVWLLVQTPVDDVDQAAVPTGSAAGGDSFDPMADSSAFASASQGAPVPPPTRRRRFAITGAIGAAVVVIVGIPLLLLTLLIAAFATGNFEISSGDPVVYRPTTIEDIPARLVEDGGDLTIDLTGLDESDFAGLTEPIEIKATLDFGQIDVIVPADLDVTVDAKTDLGDVTVFGTSDDGFDNEVVSTVESPDLELDLDVDFGEITVVRG